MQTCTDLPDREVPKLEGKLEARLRSAVNMAYPTDGAAGSLWVGGAQDGPSSASWSQADAETLLEWAERVFNGGYAQLSEVFH